MSITINGSGTITGISSGGLPDGVIATADLADNAVTAAKIGTAEQSRLCAAWVNFNGTGTVAIRASYNVSSITDNGTGDYTVNFTTALADADYSLVGGSGTGANNNISRLGTSAVVAPTSTASRITVVNSGNSLTDFAYVFVAIFR